MVVLKPIFRWAVFPTCLFIFLYSRLLSLHSQPQPSVLSPRPPPCDLFNGRWVSDPNRRPMYDETCPFHRNAWNCIRNKRLNMARINSWKWVPHRCDLPRIDPSRFLDLMRNKRIGFIGDSLNENFLVAFLCVLRSGDVGATKWKRKGAWRGAFFPKFNVTVSYHRAVLLAKYEWQPKDSSVSDQDGLKGIFRVDVDIPADDWINITDFYDVLVFNTGHWWGYDKFPKEKPLVFYKGGQPIVPPLQMLDGLKAVLDSMVSYIQKEFPRKTLKFWRLQSPRHFYGGEWNQNGSCLFNEPLDALQHPLPILVSLGEDVKPVVNLDPEPVVVSLEEDGKPEGRVELALKSLPQYDAGRCWTGDLTTSFHYWKIRDFAHAYWSRLATPSMVAERVISAMEVFSNKKPPAPLLISFDAKEVRKQAAASTQRFEEGMQGKPLSILDGIFVAIRDDIDCYPHPSKGATTWFHEVRPVKKDAVSVSRLRSCGVIFVGKANMHELGLGTAGNNPNYGFTNCELRSMAIMDSSMLGSDSSTTNYPGRVPPGPDLPSEAVDDDAVNDENTEKKNIQFWIVFDKKCLVQ